MNMANHHFEALQKMTQRIHRPVYLLNRYGQILYTSHTMMTSPELIQVLHFFRARQAIIFYGTW